MSKNRDISVTPTITAGAYAAGDAVGGLLTFASAASIYSGSGTIVKITIIDRAKQNAAMNLVLFNQTFTPTADNAPFDPSDADLANCIGNIPIAAADYLGFVDNSIARQAVLVELPFTLVAGGSSLFGQLVTSGTPTYVATDDITVVLTINR